MNDLSKNIPSTEYFDDNETINQITNQIVNYINAFVFVFDVQLKVPVWINDHFRKRMGFNEDDMHAVTPEEFLDLFHPVSRNFFLRRMKNYGLTHDEEIKTIYQLKTKDGKSIHLMTNTSVCKLDEDGKIKYLIGYAVEIDPKELRHHLSMMHNLNRQSGNLSLIDELSSRELHIIRLIAKGLTDKEISEKLNISINTTKTHRKRIIHKLNLKNSTGLVRFALENGLE